MKTERENTNIEENMENTEKTSQEKIDPSDSKMILQLTELTQTPGIQGKDPGTEKEGILESQI